MNEKTVFLKSNHVDNFRHGMENPKVIGFVLLTPENLKERPCFKVEYESDGFIDYIAEKSVSCGDWNIIS